VIDHALIGGKEATNVLTHDNPDLYKLYLAFQSRLQQHSVLTSLTDYVREHYRRAFRPAPRELFEARWVRTPPTEQERQLQMWQAGFDAWLGCQGRADAGSSVMSPSTPVG